MVDKATTARSAQFNRVGLLLLAGLVLLVGFAVALRHYDDSGAQAQYAKVKLPPSMHLEHSGAAENSSTAAKVFMYDYSFSEPKATVVSELHTAFRDAGFQVLPNKDLFAENGRVRVNAQFGQNGEVQIVVGVVQ